MSSSLDGPRSAKERINAPLRAPHEGEPPMIRFQKKSALFIALCGLVLAGCKDIDIHTEGDKDQFRFGSPFRMWATYKDETIPADAKVSWKSNKDGALGDGSELTVARLSPGTHEIEVRCEYKGKVGKRERKIKVQNDAPRPHVQEPTGVRELPLTSTLRLVGTANDTEDGVVPGDKLAWTSSLMGELGRGASVERRDLIPGTHRITLTATDLAGATGATSFDLVITNQAPSVTISAPTGTSHLRVGEELVLAGDARDPDPLTGTNALADEKLRWSSDRDGALGTGRTLRVQSLSGGVHTITLRAADEFGLESKATVRVEITNQAPNVTIVSPHDSSFFSVAATVRLEAAVDDPDGFPVEDGKIVWRSSKDGRIGSGRVFDTSSLSPGNHTITCEATDAHGASTSARVAVLLTNDAPTARITSPRNGQHFRFGEAVVFEGQGSDTEDGTLGDDRLTWRIVRAGAGHGHGGHGNHDESLGTGRRVRVRDLGFGTHVVSLVAKDADGQEGQPITIRITVDNRAPTVTIASPSNDARVTEGAEVVFAGTGHDADRNAFLADANLRWTARSGSATRNLGTGREVRVSDLAAGRWEITLTAVDPDDDHLTETTRIRLTVDAAPAPTAGATTGGATTTTGSTPASGNPAGGNPTGGHGHGHGPASNGATGALGALGQ